MTDQSPCLDHDQLTAAIVDPPVRQIVLAPPGSGKTEVVACLVAHLVDEHHVSSTDGILVLSFSRAAVAALRRRVLRAGDSAASAVRTLDSFVARLLEELDEEEWHHLDFDTRVRRATVLVQEKGIGDDISLAAHLVVDEAQDLVGTRAELVLALLQNLPESVGFSVLGDPRQAVYNFQLSAAGGMTSAQFLDCVRALPHVRELRLSGQYRAHSTEARDVARLGTSPVSGAAWLKQIRSVLADALSAGDVASLARPVERWSGTTAFLCRDNGLALSVASSLRTAGLPVTTKAAAEYAPIAPWVASALAGVSESRISREHILERLEAVTGSGENAWRLLKGAERNFRAPDRLDLRRLALRIAVKDVPAELLRSDDLVVVSTIHRAKGLEFDNVVLVNAEDLLPGYVDEDEAAVAYVALTRARGRIVSARCERPRGLAFDKRVERWAIGGYQRWQTFGFEVRGGDTSPETEADILDPASISPGERVDGLLDRTRSTLELPVWSMVLDERVVARTTPEFGSLLTRRIGSGVRRAKPWPALRGLAIEGTETMAGVYGVADAPCLKLGLRIGGMARLDWGEEGARHGGSAALV